MTDRYMVCDDCWSKSCSHGWVLGKGPLVRACSECGKDGEMHCPDGLKQEPASPPIMLPKKLEHGFWMNPTAAGQHFDLCKGTKKLWSEEDQRMLPCVGCLGCKR